MESRTIDPSETESEQKPVTPYKSTTEQRLILPRYRKTATKRNEQRKQKWKNG